MHNQYGVPIDHFANMGCPSDHHRKPRLQYAEAECEFIVESELVNPFARHRVPRKFPTTQAHAILWQAGFKLDLPEFQGCLQLEEFLHWVVIVEGVLDVKEAPDERRVSLVVNTF